MDDPIEMRDPELGRGGERRRPAGRGRAVAHFIRMGVVGTAMASAALMERDRAAGAAMMQSSRADRGATR